ncbi:S8 family peptidase [Nisaea acidiphila]|uniref:S8 family peptidase n=1 Tax=Nisaea acidiphila TaxID=1862145 RepID=A0A9J7AMB7_9PROT|nr:S8 family peptidase [Nisaea acidiphila]UUX48787.1 S8 family peptidase [Nisaea acidiphila]
MVTHVRGRKDWNTKFVRSAAAWAPLLEDTAGDDFDYGDVRIGHVDTGYVEHSVFGSWNNQGASEHILVDQGLNAVDPDREVRPTDPVDGGLNPGHGTRIGSVMYGFDPDVLVGIAPRVPVVPYRAVTSVALITAETIGQVADSINHAVEQSFCSVINMSLGARPVFNPFGAFRRAMRKLGKACDNAYENGVIVVGALGNNVHSKATYPGKYWRSICAAGLEPEFEGDRLTAVEMWKPQPEPLDAVDYQHIDVWAPAESIFRAHPKRRSGDVQDDYYPLPDGNGSSYAAATVSGAAAVWLARRARDIEAAYPPDDAWMVVEAFRSLLKTTHQGLPSDSHANNEAGMLDMKALVEADLPDAGTLDFETRLCRDMFG